MGSPHAEFSHVFIAGLHRVSLPPRHHVYHPAHPGNHPTIYSHQPRKAAHRISHLWEVLLLSPATTQKPNHPCNNRPKMELINTRQLIVVLTPSLGPTREDEA